MQTKNHNFTALTIDLVDMTILVEVKYLLRKKQNKTKNKVKLVTADVSSSLLSWGFFDNKI